MPASHVDHAKRLAREEVFPTLGERYDSGLFDMNLWRRIGEAGLLGITFPAPLGGSGGNPSTLAESMMEFTRIGCDMGLSLCWITSLSLCAKALEQHGERRQQEEHLPPLLSGESIGAAAFSEPGTGAHPGRMTTIAGEAGGRFSISGRKTYVTAGPVASLFVVAAVTGDEAGEPARRELTAFLVEASRKGVLVEEMALGFLRTAPHASVTFEGVMVGPESILGKRGSGHSDTGRSAFARERSLVLAALTGLFSAGATQVSDRFRQKFEGKQLDGAEAGSWIHHMSALEAYRRLSIQLVEAAFSGMESWRRCVDLLIYMGMSFGKWALWLEEFTVRHHLEPTFPLDVILNDLKLVMVNEGLLVREGRKRFLDTRMD